jgi:X-X-X-Leu-X-X-Gly heptad repeat protein
MAPNGKRLAQEFPTFSSEELNCKRVRNRSYFGPLNDPDESAMDLYHPDMENSAGGFDDLAAGVDNLAEGVNELDSNLDELAGGMDEMVFIV